jgi:hypothetical protein
MSQVLGTFELLDSPCYRPFSLGGRFETYKPFISLIFQFFSGRGEPQITETADSEPVDTGDTPIYVYIYIYIYMPVPVAERSKA